LKTLIVSVPAPPLIVSLAFTRAEDALKLSSAVPVVILIAPLPAV
jgi:hypothetical protein